MKFLSLIIELVLFKFLSVNLNIFLYKKYNKYNHRKTLVKVVVIKKVKFLIIIIKRII